MYLTHKPDSLRLRPSALCPFGVVEIVVVLAGLLNFNCLTVKFKSLTPLFKTHQESIRPSGYKSAEMGTKLNVDIVMSNGHHLKSNLNLNLTLENSQNDHKHKLQAMAVCATLLMDL